MPELFNDDCMIILRTLADNSVDSGVMDPPAGISFMGKEWDHDKGGKRQWIAWMQSVMQELLRVVKPGGHILVWALPRTSHWTATAIEDAGWEIRDVITHNFASGFPKSLNVGKAIDKEFGAEREIIGVDPEAGRRNKATPRFNGTDYANGEIYQGAVSVPLTAPATDEAKQWDGWGTSLKPSSEHWIKARKPLSESTVAKNVLRWSTGAINISATRIHAADANEGRTRHDGGIEQNHTSYYLPDSHNSMPAGRWPANTVFSHTEYCELIGIKKVKTSVNHHESKQTIGGRNTYQGGDSRVGHDFADENGEETVEEWRCHPDCVVAELDRQSGISKSGKYREERGKGGIWSPSTGVPAGPQYGDTGGASRFFFVSKPSKRDKTMNGRVDVKHPTVKSTMLMRYFVRMVTPPNGTCIDLFMGSGTTGVACIQEGFEFIGVEQDAESFETACQRVQIAWDEQEMEVTHG